MKLKFTRKTWYFFLLAAAAASMLGGFAVLGGMDFSGLELIVFCITGIAVLFLAAQKGAPAKDKRNYTLVFVLLMLSKLAAGGWAPSPGRRPAARTGCSSRRQSRSYPHSGSEARTKGAAPRRRTPAAAGAGWAFRGEEFSLL